MLKPTKMMNFFVIWLADERPLASSLPGPLSEILTIANLQHAASRIWTFSEPEFRRSWMKSCSSDNLYTTAPHYGTIGYTSNAIIFQLTQKNAIVNSVKRLLKINKNLTTIFTLIQCFFNNFSKMNWCICSRVRFGGNQTGMGRKYLSYLKRYLICFAWVFLKSNQGLMKEILDDNLWNLI